MLVKIKNKRRMVNNIHRWRKVMNGEEVGSHLWNYCKFSIEHEHMRLKKKG